METSFFSGSENLYKYLVTVGILLIVLTVYYPLKEKQELELLSINIENELNALNFKIRENQKEVDNFKNITKNSPLTPDSYKITIKEIKNINKQNHIDQISLENKNLELKSRKYYIKTYTQLFWVFFPLGIILVIFGFCKWIKIKKIDDKILELQQKKLELELQQKKLELQNSQEKKE